MSTMIQWLALAATVVVAAGYVPQIVHLWRERCSAGISLTAWAMWVGASLLFYAHAFSIGDGVFIALLTVQFAAQLAILLLSTRYRSMACEFHGGPPAGDG
jgi:uncharacterized protein with PQ loop repeat